MKAKLLNLALILSSLIVYLEWGTDSHTFLLIAEIDILTKLVTDPGSVVHPFTLIPMLGQLLLVITLFQRQPSKTLTYCGLGCLAFLMVFIFIIGLISANYKIVAFALPFILTGCGTLLYHQGQKARLKRQ